MMGYFRRSILVGAACLAGQTAVAAASDLNHRYETYKPETYKPAVEVPAPVVHHNFYLRGFIGMTNQDSETFTNETIQNGDFSIVHQDFDSSPLVGLGFGFIHNDRFRVDFTGEFRGSSNFRGLDTFVDITGPCPTGVCTNEHTGIKSEWLLLANAYWDIGHFRGVTPYVGAGIGAARVTLEDFWDVNLVTNGLHWARTNSEWNFAWALHAGLGIDVTDSLTLDIAYRYVDLGDGVTGTYSTYDPAFADPSLGPLTLKDLDSHDLMVGARWKFGEEVPVSYK